MRQLLTESLLVALRRAIAGIALGSIYTGILMALVTAPEQMNSLMRCPVAAGKVAPAPLSVFVFGVFGLPSARRTVNLRRGAHRQQSLTGVQAQ